MSEHFFEYNSSKEYLAKLIATENISVVRSPSYSTASFDLKGRVMHLPIWRTSEEVYDLLTIHEMAHALYTPEKGWHTAIGEDMVFKSYLNIVEDARIEKIIKRRFAGASHTFREGYARLYNDDFFGFKKHNIDINKASFIDRINCYYKLGSLMHIPFNDEEREFLKDIDAAESWEDVERIARALYAYAKDKSQTNESEQEMQMRLGRGGDGDSGDTIEIGTEESSGGRTATVDGLGSITDKTYREMMHNLENDASQKGHGNNQDQFMTITKTNPNNWIVPTKTVRAELEKSFAKVSSEINARTTKMLSQQTVVINSMVKEFEAKKRATSYARNQYSKSGRLDMKKLAKYQLAEDIFRRNIIEHKGKNHSMVMIVDWSGSMSSMLIDTVIQTINLAMFCRKVGIPFSVQIFANSIPNYLKGRPMSTTEGKYGVHNRVTMYEMLSSDSNSAEFKRDIANFYALAMWQGNFGYNPSKEEGFDYNKIVRNETIDTMHLNGTPLNAALYITAEFVQQFRAKNRSEITNVIVLTDGESGSNNCDGWRSANSHYFDPTTGITYISERGNRNWETHFMYDLIRDRNRGHVNIIGYYIASSREAVNVAREWSGDYNAKLNNGFAIVKKSPKFRADRFFIVSSSNIVVQDEWSFDQDAYSFEEYDPAAPKPLGKKIVKGHSDVVKDVKKSFKDHMKSKRDTRVVVAKFIEDIAGKIA